MTDESSESRAEILYSEGKKYDWRQDSAPAAATLARVAFQQAATMGHTGAMRALAHMIFDGRGGNQDREFALRILWSAFRRGDANALEELTDMLESYAEVTPAAYGKYATEAARHIEEIGDRLSRVSYFMDELARRQTDNKDN